VSESRTTFSVADQNGLPIFFYANRKLKYTETMSVAEIKDVLQPHRNELSTFGVQQLLLFGSAARGEANENSDLDFLVELEVYSLVNFKNPKFALEAWFAQPIDLATSRQLKPTVLEQVKKDLKRVA